MNDIDRIVGLAIQNERERIYGLLLMHPWRGPDDEEESDIDRAIKADRFDLMTLVRMGAEAGDVDALKVAAITWGKAPDAVVVDFPIAGGNRWQP